MRPLSRGFNGLQDNGFQLFRRCLRAGSDEWLGLYRGFDSGAAGGKALAVIIELIQADTWADYAVELGGYCSSNMMPLNTR